MSVIETRHVATGKVDAQDRLIAADGPLPALQRACGGELGGTLAIPELVGLVGKARDFGLRLAREFAAFDGAERITGWAEIEPRMAARMAIASLATGARSSSLRMKRLTWRWTSWLEKAQQTQPWAAMPSKAVTQRRIWAGSKCGPKRSKV